MNKYLPHIALATLGGFFLFNFSKMLSRIFNTGNIEERTESLKKEMAPQFVKVQGEIKKPISEKRKTELKAVVSRLWLLIEPYERVKSRDVLALLEGLTADEMRFVYIEFGIREIREIQVGFNFEKWSGDLISHLKNELMDWNPLDWNGESKVRALFKDTGLWVD